jgi:hypothetical protein
MQASDGLKRGGGCRYWRYRPPLASLARHGTMRRLLLSRTGKLARCSVQEIESCNTATSALELWGLIAAVIKRLRTSGGLGEDGLLKAEQGCLRVIDFFEPCAGY